MSLPNDGEEKNALKTISSTAESLTVGNYIVLFGGRDLEGIANDNKNADGSSGEFFTPDTVVESQYTKAGMLYLDWEHGQGELGDSVLGVVDWKTAQADERGIFVHRVLDRRNRYVGWIEPLIMEGLIGTSSEADPAGVQKSDDGHITRWPLRRDTLTVSPMEPRMLTENVVRAAKALGLQIAEPEAQPEDAPASVEAVTAPDELDTSQQGVDTMTEEQRAPETPQVDVAAIVAEAAQKAANAALDAYKKSLPPVDGGLQVIEDEADKVKAVKTWSIGEFLQAVATESDGARAYKSKSQPGFYDLTAAIGQKAVGSLTAAKHKAITGLSESVPADGGILVQTDWGGSLMDRVYNVGQIMGMVDTTGISANSNGMAFYANAETSRADGSRYGGMRYYWLSEGGEKTISHQTYRKIELQLNKIIVYVPATDELLQDTTALENEINQKAPNEIRFGIEDAIINGTGAGQPLGILASPALVSVGAEAGQAADTVISENIVNMWARRWVGYRDYVWLINQDVLPQLLQMNLGVGTGGQLTYMPPGGLSQAHYGTLMGRPVMETEYNPTLGDQGDIILWSPSSYKAIEKGGVQSASSIHVRFIYDETVFRFVYRYDGEPKWNLALTPHNSTNTQSPMVVLDARA